MDRLLARRTLNRSTLRRQHLLARADMKVVEMVEHLAGVQAQTPHTWYAGLWNRIEGFRAEDASGMLASRKLVRIALQRSTIHLVSARDCLAMRPLLEPVTRRITRGTFGKRLAGVDLAELAKHGRGLVEARPVTFAELGKALAERWPDNDPHALAQGVRWLVPLVQVPPRGLWGRSGPVTYTCAESWLGLDVPAMTPEMLVRRYLAAFGPASVKDVQTWCGLTRLREIVDSMDLVRYRDEDGRRLYDLPGLPIPSPDVEAPVRLMYDYDNLFLSHADRTRVISEQALEVAGVFAKANVMWRLILVDGFTAGDWTINRAEGTANVTIHQWQRFPAGDLDAAVAEAGRLLEFLVPEDSHEVLTRLGSSRP